MKRTFRAAAQACPVFCSQVQSGLRALRESDRAHVRARDSRRITGSVDVDSALAGVLPNSPRWDYGLGYRPSTNTDEEVHWVEVHPATDGEVRVVQAKLDWLKEWLVKNAAELHELPRCFVWVSSGSTHITRTSPALKRLAQKGCRHVGRVYTIA